MSESLSARFKQNKPTWLWRGALTILFAILSFLGAWLFTEVSAAPKVYQTKTAANTSEEKQGKTDERQDTEIREVRKEIQEGFRRTQEMIIDALK
jgi:hypothetical protein